MFLLDTLRRYYYYKDYLSVYQKLVDLLNEA